MQNDIRKWIELVEAVAYRDRDLTVISDPTKTQVRALAEKAAEGLRGLIDYHGTLYVWDAFYANHDEVARKLGIDDDISLHLWTAYVELDAAVFDNADDEERLEEIIQTVKTNPHLIRLYGATFNLKVELDGYEVWR